MAEGDCFEIRIVLSPEGPEVRPVDEECGPGEGDFIAELRR